MRTPIKDFYGRVLGYVEDKSNGDRVAYDFYGRVLGTFIKKRNVTTDFYGRVLGQGDFVVSLIRESTLKK